MIPPWLVHRWMGRGPTQKFPKAFPGYRILLIPECFEEYPLEHGVEVTCSLVRSISIYYTFFFALVFATFAFGTPGSEVFAVFCSSRVACMLAWARR